MFVVARCWLHRWNEAREGETERVEDRGLELVQSVRGKAEGRPHGSGGGHGVEATAAMVQKRDDQQKNPPVVGIQWEERQRLTIQNSRGENCWEQESVSRTWCLVKCQPAASCAQSDAWTDQYCRKLVVIPPSSSSKSKISSSSSLGCLRAFAGLVDALWPEAVLATGTEREVLGLTASFLTWGGE